MTVHTILRRVRVIDEAGASEFGISQLGDVGSFLDVPVTAATFDPGHNLETPGTVIQRIDRHAPHVRMPSTPTMSMTIKLGAPAPSTGGMLGLGVVLGVMFGDRFDSAADTVQGSGTATTTAIDVTSGAAYQPGSAIGVVIGGVLHIREIASITSNTVTLKIALPSVPADGAVIMGCHTFAPASGHYDSATSPTLQALVNTAVGDQTWLLTGGHVANVTLSTPVGGFPEMTIEWMFADAQRVSNALADAAYNHRHHIVADSEFRVASAASSTYSQTNASVVDWEFNLRYQQIKAPGGINNVRGYVRVGDPTTPLIGGSFAMPVEDDAFDELVEAGESSTKQCITMQCGSLPSDGALLLVAPRAQIVDALTEDLELIHGQRITWVGDIDASTSGGSDPYVNAAAFRMHFARITAA